MVVAMAAMRMMEASVNQIVNMIAMGNGGMPAIGTMDVFGGMFRGSKTGSAVVRVGGVNRNRVFVHMVAVRVMQMAVVKIVHVPFVLDGGVSASRTVDVRMVGMSGASM
jgi:hypothetical protein